MPSVNCFVIWKHKAVQVKDYPIEDGRVKVSKEWQPSFGLDDFIPEKKDRKFYQFWKSDMGRNMLILKEDYPKALKPTSTLFDENWTKKEAKSHVAKEVSKAHETQKPFSNWQLMFVLIPLMITLVGVLYIASKIF